MPNNVNGKAILNVRQINLDDVQIYCTYPLSKGVKLKDYLVDKNMDSKRFCVIGVGGGGINIVHTITENNNKYISLMAHIDHSDIYDMKDKNKLFVMCDIADEEILTVDNRRVLSEFVSAHKEVYIISTLGRETHHSQAVEKIVQHIYRIHRKITLIIVKPFLFEVVPGRIREINSTLNELEKYAEKILVFHNEDLLGLEEVNNLAISDSFTFLNHIIATTIEEGYTCGDEIVSNIYLKELLNEKC